MPEGSGQKHRDNTLMQMGLLGMACHKNKSSLSPKAAKNLTHDGYFLHLTVSVETTDLKPRNGSMVTKKLILMLILTQLHIVNILNQSILRYKKMNTNVNTYTGTHCQYFKSVNIMSCHIQLF